MQSLMAASRLGYGPLAKLSQEIRPNMDLSKRGAALGRGPQALSKLPAAAWSNTWPAPASTLDLDFANNRGFVRGSGQGGAMDAVTFTRASSGNWVDNTGVLRTGARTFTGTANALGVNLVPSPQNFENAAWTKQGTTISSNSILAPDGSLSAYTVFENFAFSNHGVWQLITTSAGTTYTYSAYLKYFTRQYVRFAFVTGGGVQSVYIDADLINGTIVNQGPYSTATQAGASITNVGNGWYRVSVTGTLPSNTTYVTIYTKNNSSNSNPETAFQFSGDPNQGVYIWGAQLEVGSSATTYYPTNINAPRFDWASTTITPNVNLLQATEQFDNAYWTKNGSSITANTAGTTDPTGGSSADVLVESTNNGTHSFFPATQPATANLATAYTASVYMKQGARQYGCLQIATDAAGKRYSVLVDLSNGTVTTTNSSGSPVNVSNSVTSVGNGWYRVTATATNTSGTVTIDIGISNTGTPTWSFGQPSYLGNGTSGIYTWGAQLEAASSATAYQAISQPTTNTPLVANSTCNGLLIEESRTNRILWCRDGLNGGTAVGTNFLLYSQQFQQGTSWSTTTTNVGILGNQTTAPDSTNTAAAITPTTSTALHYTQQVVNSVVAGVYTISVYAKPNGYNWIALGEQGGTAWAYFNVSTGTVGNTNGSPTTSITSAGSGWYRCSITFTSAGGTRGAFVLVDNANGSLATWTPNGTSGVYAWGAQQTQGATLTDYQVTTTAAIYAWSKSNVTVAKTATGIDGVANAATTITASANNAVLIQPISLASGSRTGSVYLKRITGTGNVQVTLDGSTWSTVDLSNGLWNRIVLSGTVTNPCVGVLLATNGDAVAMDYAQVEDGAFVTSPILTTTATATRAAETASLSARNIITNAVTITTSVNRGVTPGNGALFSIGGNNNGGIFFNVTQFSAIRTNSAWVSNVDTTCNLTGVNKFCLSASAGYTVVSCNSSIPTFNTVEGYMSFVGNNLYNTLIGIGYRAASNDERYNGCISSLIIYPQKSSVNAVRVLST